MNLLTFIVESNRIEGIEDVARASDELPEYKAFLALPFITVSDTEVLAFALAGAPLRDKARSDVMVGNHIPPKGGPGITRSLKKLLSAYDEPNPISPYLMHHEFETLHPFMDGNGRVGRALWLWGMMRWHWGNYVKRTFLHEWYYQSLEAARGES